MMQKLTAYILILSSISCGAHTNGNSAKSWEKPKETTTFNPKIHKPAPKDVWQKRTNEMTFTDISNPSQVLLPPKERNEKFRASLFLPSLHSWFRNGETFQVEYHRPYKLLVLNKIPEQVFKDIINISASPATGFGILDKAHWINARKMQSEGYKLAVLEDAPESIAGLYIDDRKLIAFDVFSNSGTLTHELRHHAQYQKLDKGFRWFKKDQLDDTCIHELALFFGELDASTEQLPEWSNIVENFRYYDEDISKMETTGNSPSFFEALSANMNYPVSNSIYALNSESCPNDVKLSVQEIMELTGNQKNNFFGSELNYLRYKARREYKTKLSKTLDVCSKSNNILECEKLNNELVAISEKINSDKKSKSELLTNYYNERKSEIPKILERILSDEMREELCERVVGYHFLDECGKVN